MNIEGLQQDIPLAPYTTFKIGGPAKYFVVVKTAEEMTNAVKEANAAAQKWVVLGGGSDVLIADAGFDGLVIKTELREIEIDEEKMRVRAGSGVLLNALIQQSAQRSLCGLEFAVGVPATIGGAVWANLGARGKEIGDHLIEVTIVDAQGNTRTMTKEQCDFSYRESIFKKEHFVILDALFQLEKGDRDNIKQRILEFSAKRKEQQDIGTQCAGCVFRNPKEQTEVAAAELIDQLGLKGKQIGGARVSDLHANFIVNTGTATADQVAQLISYIKQQVRDKKGIQLMEEVEYIGFE